MPKITREEIAIRRADLADQRQRLDDEAARLDKIEREIEADENPVMRHIASDDPFYTWRESRRAR